MGTQNFGQHQKCLEKSGLKLQDPGCAAAEAVNGPGPIVV